MSGETFLNYPPMMRAAYVAGVVDGVIITPALEKRTSAGAQRVAVCIQNVTNTQLAAMTTKRLAEHPEDWGIQAAVSVLDALGELCGIGA